MALEKILKAAWKCKCERCFFEWVSDNEKPPIRCARCKSMYWEKSRDIGYDWESFKPGEIRSFPHCEGEKAQRRNRSMAQFNYRTGRNIRFLDGAGRVVRFKRMDGIVKPNPAPAPIFVDSNTVDKGTI